MIVPLVSETLGSMTGESAVTLCLFAWCQAVQETDALVFLLERGGVLVCPDASLGPSSGPSRWGCLLISEVSLHQCLSGKRRSGPPRGLSQGQRASE